MDKGTSRAEVLGTPTKTTTLLNTFSRAETEEHDVIVAMLWVLTHDRFVSLLITDPMLFHQRCFRLQDRADTDSI